MNPEHAQESQQRSRDEEREHQSIQSVQAAWPASFAVRTDNFIEADEHGFDDADSTLGDDVLSSTTSLNSAVTRYVHENGRRYHAPREDSYYLPNDEEELDRLNIVHQLFQLRTGGELHFAPIGPDPHKILDLGTGTGIWAMEMGDKYPSAEIIGNDISPIQSELVPPNVFFEVDDIENDWIFSSKFDFIHSRYLVGSIKDWPRLIGQAYEFLKPGGWLEMADLDLIFYTTHGEFTDDCPAGIWAQKVSAGIQAFGMETNTANQLEKWMKDAGFLNVENVFLPLPIGPWPKDKKLKEIGSYNLWHTLDGLEAFSLRVLTTVYKWEVEEVMVFLAQVRKNFFNPKMQIQHDYRIVYGQKPPETESN